MLFSHRARQAIGLALIIAVASLTGCATNMEVPLKDATPSGIAYQNSAAAEARSIRFVDERSESNKRAVLTGLIPMQLTHQGKPFDAPQWLERNVIKELNSRGVQSSAVQTDSAQATVKIARFQIENHRASGFSPLVTFTSVQTDVLTASGSRRVVAYVKRGKVPVWTFDEVIDPTFNDALSIAAKEVAAKLNQFLYRQSISDAEVQRLIADIKRDGTTRPSAYLDVYQLGFGNNLSATPALAELTAHPAEYVRLAAISALGILGAADQLPLLKRLAETKTGLWQDRAMALKAIGDLGSPEAKAYIQQQWKVYELLSDKESTWNKAILSLYQ